MRIVGAALILSFASISLVRAHVPIAPSTSPTTIPSTAPDDAISRLIAQLSADEWKDRQRAQDELAAMGPAIVPRLQEVIDRGEVPEAVQRAAAAIAQIQSTQQIGPSSITLHMKDALPREIMAEISQQAMTNLQPAPPELWELRPWPKMTVDFDGEPFWKVMRAISDQTGIELRQWGNDGQLRLMQGVPGAASAGRWTLSGPFLITLVRCTRTQVIDYQSGDASSNDFSIVFTAAAEPKLRVARAAYAAKLEEATDDKGNSLLPSDEVENLRGPMDAAFVGNSAGLWQFTARLQHRPDIGTKIKTLRGSATAVIQTRFETIEVPAILSATNVTRTAGGLELTVNAVKKVGERYEMAVSVARDRNRAPGSPAIDWERVQQAINDIKLLDERGQSLYRSSLSSGGTDESIDVTMTFVSIDAMNGRRGRVSEPSKLSWQVATDVKEILVPFEFHDVPLPR